GHGVLAVHRLRGDRRAPARHRLLLTAGACALRRSRCAARGLRRYPVPDSRQAAEGSDMARKKDEGGAEAGARLSPVDVQQVQFRRALRGYEEQEVDDFLDRVTEELTRLLDERRALTERAGQLATSR